ncbi:MAG: histidine kinase [Lachnospiraceae bacterium]|nr:histidine kinase [Lachnospiraceae bacterium]
MFELAFFVILVTAAVLLLISLGKIRTELQKVREERRLLEERIKESEEKLNDSFSEIDGMKAKLTLSQINPHFIFNTLNTIYYLCEKDSGEAQNAIEDFSAYLRENMDSIKNMEPIPFNKELMHVKQYLELEKLRYEDDLKVVYDINARDFSIPALSVQALVENAVHHGLGKSNSGGTVTISSWKGRETIVVKVEDDGVGFNVNAKLSDGKSHTGIENVRSLLERMCGGTLEIISERGKGTVAMIRIPAKRDEEGAATV